MKKTGFDAIARALHDAQVPFLVVDGIAVIHHGYGRAAQVDLVIRLEKAAIFARNIVGDETRSRPSSRISPTSTN